MTVVIHFGRRVPKTWAKRFVSQLKGLVTFQENIWLIITQEMKLVSKKANSRQDIKINIVKQKEKEDLNFDIEWFIVRIQSTPSMEEEEYREALNLYSKFGK